MSLRLGGTSEDGMKIYGYSVVEPDELKKMKEVSIRATSEGLREIAGFLIMTANEIASGNDGSPDHFHLRDHVENWNEEFPDIIVINTNVYSCDES
ncbi:MAG TPA: hypothetical protein VF268_02475 [Gammaproteobacteria bacterium]